MFVKDGSPAVVAAGLLSGGTGGVHMHKGESIMYEEVSQAVKRLRNGKAAGTDGITAGMLKCVLEM